MKADKNHTAEQKLQSYIINYAEQFFNGKGRQIIGWEEILEGGLVPNATVMSWRGIDVTPYGCIIRNTMEHAEEERLYRFLEMTLR